jgi:hypothetical protein
MSINDVWDTATFLHLKAQRIISVAVLLQRMLRILNCLQIAVHNKHSSEMLGQTSWVRSSHQNKQIKVYTNRHPQTLNFRGTAPTIAWSQSFRFLSLRANKNPNVCGANWNEGTVHQRIFVACQTIAAALGLLKESWVHGQTCPCMHWFRWRTCCTLAVNCDLMNSKNSAAVKLGTCLSHVLCHSPCRLSYDRSIRFVFIVPAGTLRLPWLRFFRDFSSIVRQMPG